MALVISNQQYNSFLSDSYVSVGNTDGLRLFIAKSELDKETEIKSWASSKKIIHQNNKAAIASSKTAQDTYLDGQITEMDSIINS